MSHSFILEIEIKPMAQIRKFFKTGHLTINNQYRCKEGNKTNMWEHFKRRTSFRLPLNGLQFHVGMTMRRVFSSTRPAPPYP